ncbi:MAG: response regulator transcription factor [Flavobacteriales bacterium]|jgi:DNA-binding NarL/FixJ family response regulator|nr:response regulator transcription factor [Flavobacteriales bacterium]MBK9287528.1 response regulator transcription factor [Flavobacteriales bacterium]MBL0037310.1 response regulator transcription factor [Flavobacteriales bacterium]
MSTTRILIADPLEILAAGLRSWLSEAPEMEVVGHAGTGQAVLERLEEGPVDLILMEVSLPGRDGIDTMREVRRHHPAVKVLAYSALTEIEYVNSMLIEGASGYLVKGSSKEELITAIRAVMNDQPYLSPAARESTLHGYDHTQKRMDGEYIGLTEREREIIRLVAQERTNDEIAKALFISVDTVKTHRKHLMTKLNVRSLAGLVKYARDRCWI